MSTEISLDIVAMVDRARAASTVISYATDTADKEFPAICWSVYGLLQTNQIAVLAKCGSLRFGVCAKSSVNHPPMSDRVFGIDADDLELSIQLGAQLWEQKGPALIAAAQSLVDVEGRSGTDAGDRSAQELALMHAINIFGSDGAAREWMTQECRALNFQTPAAVLQLPDGLERVTQVLNRIQRGVIT